MCVWFDFQDTLKELLPSWSQVQRYKEVLCFVSDQSPNAHALINDVYEKFGESCLDMLRTRQADKGDEFGEMRLAVEKQSYDTGVFVTMYREATVPLTGMPGHNSYLNWYHHYNLAEKPLDRSTTAVHIPSKLFWFIKLETDIVTSKDQKVQNCAIYIEQSSQKVG